jgi:hypothetical protein
MNQNSATTSVNIGASLGANKADILQLVQEEMQVYDSTDSFVGKVGEVQFGADADAVAPGAGPARPARKAEPGNGSLIDALRDAFTGRGDGERSELVGRLRQSGFIRLAGSGLLRGRRYILPEQVDYVDSEGVHLNVQADKLLAD